MAWLGAGMGEGIRPAAGLPPTFARFARAHIRARRRDVSDIWRSASGGLRRRRPRRRAVERRQRRVFGPLGSGGAVEKTARARGRKGGGRGGGRRAGGRGGCRT